MSHAPRIAALWLNRANEWAACASLQFAFMVPAVTADIPNLADDVDTLADLERLDGRLGPHTSAVLEELRAGLTR